MIRMTALTLLLAPFLLARSLLEVNTDFSSHEVQLSQLSGGSNYPTFWTGGLLLAENSDNDDGMMLYGSLLKTAPLTGNWLIGYGAKLAWIDGKQGSRSYSGLAIPLRVKAIYRVPIDHPVRLSAEYGSAPRMLTSGDVDVYDEIRLEGSFFIAPRMYGYVGLRQLYIAGLGGSGPAGNSDLFEFVDGGYFGFKYYF